MEKTTKKELGFIGLGRMGLNMATHLVEKGYRVIGIDPDDEAKSAAREVGVEVVDTYEEMIAELSSQRLIWIMVPSKHLDQILRCITPVLGTGDTIIDGGNSFYQDSVFRYKELKDKELNFLDCGTSGGVTGARSGLSLMVGGDASVFNENEGLFQALSAQNAYARVGESGAGHFVKMVHNSIEYGMIGAIAEGFTTLHENADNLDINIREVFKPYEHESIISGKLISYLRQAYEQDQIYPIKGEVPVGQTESEMEHITTISDAKVLKAALEQRKSTRETPSLIGKFISAMRNKFGGHKVIKKE